MKDDIVESVETLVRKGMIEEAIKIVENLQENFDKVIALCKIAELTRDESFLEDAIYFLKKIKDHDNKAIGYGEVAKVYALLGYEEESLELFEEAVKLTKNLNPVDKAITLTILANRLALAGFVDLSLEMFQNAFAEIIELNIELTKKTDLIIQLAEILEASGDALDSENALKFYEMAQDIYKNLKLGQREGIIEKKIELTRTLMHTSYPDIRKLAYEGRFIQALHEIEKRFGGNNVIPLLELTAWAYKTNVFERLKLKEITMEKLSASKLSDEEKFKVVQLLLEIDDTLKAYEIAITLESQELREKALVLIGLKMIDEGEVRFVEEKIFPLLSDEKREEFINFLKNLPIA
ncbi:hypothetical protein PFDSM3638_01520 [Pyrococcus furiosus DSM 3638]|uniref:TRP-repeat-containing protein n=3 Tax=Pyrococcus furiosus TaxID=2261 RepID=A0A5C0XMU7_PYRFU|nr:MULTISPECIES: hypothetical protein [Pyrococcus]AAL80440.1 hypothetical protein PF0316 [Pyrococcus furiosus DSM 3638]AFN03105.1 hypothetical protein PFC_00655 [Pyrococcus furiosus COM1]MDK2870462.1 hypothetical protein [Pyrococcus sp.]QEK78032.1 hypothetical protein PFDSM3638_01520 [Pyrococcus furiosus DSM 3638]